MLGTIRKISKTFIAKILFGGVLIVSFGLWGISDYITQGVNSQNVVAIVDGDEISLSQFQAFYNQQRKQLNLGNIDAKSAQAMNLGGLLLERYIADMVVTKRLKELNLQPDPQSIIPIIKQEKIFHGPDGKFSAEKYTQVLQQSGLTEAGLIENISNQVAQGWFFESAIPSAVEFPLLTKKLHDYRYELRNIAYFQVNFADLPRPATPNPAKITEWFAQNQEQFRQPQYRSGGVLTITAAEIGQKHTPSADEIQKYYNDNLAQFATPKLVSMEQLLADDQESAQKIKSQLQTTSDFSKIKNAKYSKISKLSAEQAKLAGLDSEFAQPVSSISEPKQTSFGWAIIRITAVEDAGQKSLAVVKDQIIQNLKNDYAIDQLNKLSKTIDDAAAGGEKLAAIAQKFNAQYASKYTAIPLIDRTGLGKNNEKTPQLPEDSYRQLFELKSGETRTIENQDSIQIIGVDAIVDSAVPAYNEIALKVNAAYLNEQITQQMETLARDWVKSLNEGANIEKIAQNAKAKLDRKTNITRQDALSNKIKLDNIPAGFVFSSANNAQYLIHDNGVIIAQSSPANQPINDNNLAQIRQSFAQNLLSDYQQGLIEQLRARYNVRIKNEVLNQVY